ncbi:MAG: hypothetical protein IPQ07_08405 [Myxococcales bacterium]|nr:hypothetical protein [Myxococcales bacterium]
MTRKPTPPEPTDEPEAKDRVIHTRVPESLEAELRERAQELGMSVSNLVRNVLGHAFGLVGDVVADGHAIARAARGDKKPAAQAQPASSPVAPPATAIDDVLGWQPIVLGKNALCARCNALLPRGQDAAVGVGTQLVVCPSCLKELRG